MAKLMKWGSIRLTASVARGQKSNSTFSVLGSKDRAFASYWNCCRRFASVQASCIDAANPCTFVRFEDVGIDETILPNDFNKLSQWLRWLEEIREAGEIAMGVAKSKSEVPRTIPKIAIASPPCTHKSLSGSVVEGSSIDLTVRFIGDTFDWGSMYSQDQGFYCTLANTNTIAIGHSSSRI